MSVAVPLPDAASSWWRAKTRRERAVSVAFAALVLVALLWVLAWRPLVQDAHRLERETERSDRALLQARRDAQDIARLTRSTLPGVVDASAALDRSLAQSGLRPAVTELAWQGRRVRLTLASAPFATTVAWLEGLQREAGLRVVEATFSALESPGRVRAEIVLASG